MRVPIAVPFLFYACLISLSMASCQPAPSKSELAARTGEWVDSDDGDLSLRLRLKSARLATGDSVIVIAEIRNNRKYQVTILRPFGDGFSAVQQIKMWGEQRQIKYDGPIADYDLDAEAYMTIGFNEVAADTMELSVQDFRGSDAAGTYTLRFDYENRGTWDNTVASERRNTIWRGSICSREIQLQRSTGTASPPMKERNIVSLDKDLRVLELLNKTLVEKPDDAKALRDAAVLSERLAPHLREKPVVWESENLVVWESLIKTRTLQDGLSLATAEKVLGRPPTWRSNAAAGWTLYFDATGKRVTPYLQAKVTNDGLVDWKVIDQ